ncbi:MFS transporter [uncultured Corynebacterium sp.]|uniref:MFS transporter n=1 Tax=uncultured Corynebacterium sp. TaxID=159447 RepID=UPI0025FF68CE|nr:MFS transporter [uncultured Corynebacterium sp.]
MTDATTGPATPPSTPAEAVAPPPSRDPLQRRTLTVLAVSQVVGTVGVGIAPSIGILLATEVTDSELWSGLARTASTLGAAILGIPLGVLAARFGRRTALASGWWISAVGAAILVGAAQWSLVMPMFLGLLLIGAGQATSLQSRFAATDRAAPADKAKALALIVWVGTVGSVLGPNLGVPGEALHRSIGLTVFAGAFLIAAVCLALAGVMVFWWLRPDPLEDRVGRTPRVAGEERVRFPRVRLLLVEIRSSPQARAAATAVVIAQVIMVVVMTMTPVHMHHQGDSVTLVGVTISLHIIGMYALAPVVGMLTDRYGPRPPVAGGVLILVTSAAVCGAASDSTAGVIVGLFLLGLGWSFVNVAGSAMFSQAVAEGNRATAQGGLDASSNLVSALGAFLAGPLMAVSSFPVVSLVVTVFLVPVVMALPTPAYARVE